MNDQTIIRVSKNKDNPYVMIDRRTLEDVRLSLKAKGLLAYLLSRPDDWTVNMSHIIKQSNDGRDAHYNTMNELIDLGYVQRIRHIDPKTKQVKGFEYRVYEYPLPENPDTGKPYTENPYINNNDSTNIDDDEGKPENVDVVFAEIVKLYEQIHMITPLIADHLEDALDEYGYMYVQTAIERTIESRGTSWRYVARVLENMRKYGYDWTPPNNKQKQQKERVQHGFTKDTRPDEVRERNVKLIDQFIGLD